MKLTEYHSIPAQFTMIGFAYPMLLIGIWQQIFAYWAKQAGRRG